MKNQPLTLFDLQQWKNEMVTEVVNQTANEISKQLAALNLKPQNPMMRSSAVKELLGCSQSKLESLMRSGALPCVKVQGSNYFKKADVEKLFTNQY